MVDLHEYVEYIKASCAPGSNLPGSYMRALRYVSEFLKTSVPKYTDLPPVWEIESLDVLDELYAFLKAEEKKGDNSVFATTNLPQSYLKQRFCTSALRILSRFISERKREDMAVEAYSTLTSPEEVSEKLVEIPVLNPDLYLEDDILLNSREGKEVVRQVKQRQNQNVFRRIVLLNYDCKCCVTGLPIKEVLRASHIVGWAEDETVRLSPDNGLCLSATYDAAFDRHLISFDEQYRLILAPSLKEYFSNDEFIKVFRTFEGKRMTRAVRFQPSQKLLGRHRELLK